VKIDGSLLLNGCVLGSQEKPLNGFLFKSSEIKGDLKLNFLIGFVNKFIVEELNLFEKSYFSVEGLIANKLVLNTLYGNPQSFVVSKTKVLKKFSVLNCFVSSVRFINCDFSEAEIHFENSTFENFSFMNINWGKVSAGRISSTLFWSNKLEKISEARDIYRQLKLSLDNSKNYIDADKFYALEMKAYEKELSLKVKGRLLFKDLKTFEDWLEFKVHGFISNHGLSWTRPLFLVVFLTVLFFTLLLAFHLKFAVETFGTVLAALGILLLFILFNRLDALKKYKVFINLTVLILLALLSYFTFVSGDLAVTSSKEVHRDFWQFLNCLSELVNPFGILKKSNDCLKQLGLMPNDFFYLFYQLAVAVLIYQTVVALRRRVKR